MLYHGKRGATFKIVLVGVSINALIGAATSALMLLHSDKSTIRVTVVSGWYWRCKLGTFKHDYLLCNIRYYTGLLRYQAYSVLMLGDEMAKLLGHNVERSRFYLIVVSTLLAGIAVSVSGLIGFVGLVVPHMLRLLVGNDYKYLLPLSCLGGGILLVFADAIARSWFDPIELPVGILLSFLGGPFFLYLIHRGKTA